MMEKRPLRIGVTGPFSGPRRAYGDMLKAVSHRFSNRCELVFGDDEARPEKALAVAEHFIQWQVDAVIGHFNSECARQAGALYRQHEIPFLMPASTAPDLVVTTSGFRICPSDRVQVIAMAQWLRQNRFAATIETDETAYAVRLAGLLRAQYPQMHTSTPDAKRVSILLGTHVWVAAQILQRKALEQVYLAPDDCAVAEFDELLTEVADHAIHVVRPNPTFEQAVTIAFELVLEARQQERHLGQALKASQAFQNGEYRQAGFTVVKLGHTNSHAVVAPCEVRDFA
ncbi:ABC transporter substrate-binding protein [Allorhizobium undicola]|uniref:ABC transporter substrate-binding protein n=1 Tax=Allorhizobium undicola TaxID=78527 RepID=UPI003D32A360